MFRHGSNSATRISDAWRQLSKSIKTYQFCSYFKLVRPAVQKCTQSEPAGGSKGCRTIFAYLSPDPTSTEPFRPRCRLLALPSSQSLESPPLAMCAHVRFPRRFEFGSSFEQCSSLIEGSRVLAYPRQQTHSPVEEVDPVARERDAKVHRMWCSGVVVPRTAPSHIFRWTPASLLLCRGVTRGHPLLSAAVPAARRWPGDHQVTELSRLPLA